MSQQPRREKDDDRPLDILRRAIHNLDTFLVMLLTQFRLAFLAFLLVSIPSMILLFATSWDPQLQNQLSDSRATWWGAVTSIFVHYDTFHLASNVIALFAFILLFVILQGYLTVGEKHGRSLFLLWSVFFSGILANVFFLLASSGSAAGASGVVYASEGVVAGFAFFIMFPEDFNLAKFKEHFLGKANKRRGLRGLVVFASFFLEATLFPRFFLAVGPGVNSFVHIWAFEISFTSVVVYMVSRLIRTGHTES
jgi:membrane associated rhomboid family serine protease